MRYSELAEVYEKLEKTSKRLAKTEILADLFSKLSADESYLVLMATGSVFPSYEEKEIGISRQLAIKAISKSTGFSPQEINHYFRKTGDLGKVAEELITRKKQRSFHSQSLSTEKVFNNIRKAADFTGAGTVEKKVSAVAELLSSAKPVEARYVIRTVLEELRVGIGEGAIRDAIVWACFGKHLGMSYDKEKNKLEVKDRKEYNEIVSKVEKAYDMSNDFSEVFKSAKKGLSGIGKIGMEVGKPIKVMLYLKAESIEDALKRLGKPLQAEFKYDGFRLLVHKKGKSIMLFTRRLDNVTKQFPDVVESVKKHVKGESFILDTEAVGYDREKNYKPFQQISQRIKRKYDIEKLVKELPVELNVFDVVFYNGKSFLDSPFKERRKLLERIVKPEKWRLVLAKKIVTGKKEDIEQFNKESLAAGQEGVMLKSLSAPYKPGARVGYGLKYKPGQRELDLAITGAEFGTGKRAGWFSSFILSCRSEGKMLTIGKVGTGIKEKEEQGVSFRQLTKMLKPLVISEKARQVEIKPKVIISVMYQEIQKSPKYSSGYALRFPRLVRLRPDRSKSDIATLKEVKAEYEKQGRKR